MYSRFCSILISLQSLHTHKCLHGVFPFSARVYMWKVSHEQNPSVPFVLAVLLVFVLITYVLRIQYTSTTSTVYRYFVKRVSDQSNTWHFLIPYIRPVFDEIFCYFSTFSSFMTLMTISCRFAKLLK